MYATSVVLVLLAATLLSSCGREQELVGKYYYYPDGRNTVHVERNEFGLELGRGVEVYNVTIHEGLNDGSYSHVLYGDDVSDWEYIYEGTQDDNFFYHIVYRDGYQLIATFLDTAGNTIEVYYDPDDEDKMYDQDGNEYTEAPDALE